MTKVTLKCTRCDHEWTPRNAEEVKMCPKCKSLKWNEPKIIKEELNKSSTSPTPQMPASEPESEPQAIEELVVKIPLREQMMASGRWDPQPMWDMEKRVITGFKSGRGNTKEWQQDFKEWFLEAFHLRVDMAWSSIKFIEKGSVLRTNIKESIRASFGSGYALDALIDIICDGAVAEERKAKERAAKS